MCSGIATSDDYFTGTRAAACGGVTTVMHHMAHPIRPVWCSHPLSGAVHCGSRRAHCVIVWFAICLPHCLQVLLLIVLIFLLIA